MSLLKLLKVGEQTRNVLVFLRWSLILGRVCLVLRPLGSDILHILIFNFFAVDEEVRKVFNAFVALV